MKSTGSRARSTFSAYGVPSAQAAARALLENTELDAESIVRKSLTIAGELCIYTNQNHTVEVLQP